MDNLHAKYNLPFTICFCTNGNKVLMLYRNKRPNANKWNGVGGKLDEGESPEECIIREVEEETGIKLLTNEVSFRGIVTFSNGGGMYAYVADLNSDGSVFEDQLETREGQLEWKDIEWARDLENTEVVSNIPYFLPLMLNQTVAEYKCVYDEDGKLEDFTVSELDFR